MRAPILTIFYQYNPWNSTIGGIQTSINSFIKYAPSDLQVRLVGTGDAATEQSAIGQWQEAELGGRAIQFMPLLRIAEDNVRRRIPTTVKYTAALLGKRFASDFFHFHRLEPTVAALKWQGDKTLFIHNDIRQQMAGGDRKNAILWQQFPQVYFALERLLVHQFTQILSCNLPSAQFYQQQYPQLSDRIDLFRYSIDPDVFYPATSDCYQAQRQQLVRQLHLPDETEFILFAGRLHPQKDPLLLVRSMAHLRDRAVHLLIAGGGELADAVRAEMTKLGLERSITLLGSQRPAQVADLHRLSRLVILTSLYEGLPLVVLEALTCGIPVVTTRAGDTPRVLTTESGLVCEERTPPAVAQAIGHVLDHPQRYPVAACTQAAQPYSARQVVRDICDTMLQRWQPTQLSGSEYVV